MYFGRPWRAYATVYFVDSVVRDAVIQPEGWSEWSGKLATATYGDYDTKGWDPKNQVSPATLLTKKQAQQLTVAKWMDGWDAEAVEFR